MDNPFAGQDIVIEEAFRERIDSFVQRREGKDAAPVHQPFRRNVDLWFFAIILAIKKGAKLSKPSGKTYKAAEGVVLGSDEWRPTALILLAVAETEKVEIVEAPGEMMRIANGYAHAGLPILFSLLDERGEDTALDYLCDVVEDLLD